MSNRFDTLFDPDLLRQSWRQEPEPETNTGIQPEVARSGSRRDDLWEAYGELCRCIHQKFSTVETHPLNILLQDLKLLLQQAFPLEKAEDPSAEHPEVIDAEGIAGVLNALEDLLEAFDA